MLFGNTMTNGLNPNAIPNPDITWEKALYTNFGIDVGNYPVQRGYNVGLSFGF